ncbi:hypothetical protein LMG28727_06660 [Paraburkholderia kirstenboschensis]|nr:hypothetical protein LMG28727_06660 [Paraburkholderia kirstenboschensis]
MRATRMRQRERTEASQTVDPEYHLPEDFMAWDIPLRDNPRLYQRTTSCDPMSQAHG